MLSVYLNVEKMTCLWKYHRLSTELEKNSDSPEGGENLGYFCFACLKQQLDSTYKTALLNLRKAAPFLYV